MQCEELGFPYVEGGYDGGFSPSENLELWVPQGPPPAVYGSGLMTNNGLKNTKEMVVNSSKVNSNRMWTDDGFTVPQITSTNPSVGFKRSRTFLYNNN